MPEPQQLESDLGFVRQLLQNSRGHRSPASIYLLWAVLCLVGFALVDFAPRRVGLFWLVAGPLGGLLSMWLGWRQDLREGQMRNDLAIRHGLHWAAMMAVILLCIPLGVRGHVRWNDLARVILLLVTFSYFLAGVHLERPLLWVGALMAAGYLALFFIPAFSWTLLGAVVAAGLALAAFVGRGDRAAAQA